MDPGSGRSKSIKLDADRYKRLSRVRCEMELSAQDIFIEAFDLRFKVKRL